MSTTTYKSNGGQQYECDVNAMAKGILENIKPTPFNREIIESWREVAVTSNPEPLYNTPDVYDEE